MIRSAVIAFAIAILGPVPALALSCPRGGVATTYQFAAQSPADYVIGAGQLTFTGPSDPPHGITRQGGDLNQQIGYTQPAQFEGRLFDGTGFDDARTLPITIDVTCVAAWCGSAEPVDYGLFFFRLVDGTYILDADACGTYAFPQAGPQQLNDVISCHAGSCNSNF